MSRTTEKGREFLRLHEGNPLTCYLDPVGIPTIGTGFTNRSRVLTEMVGKLVPGKTKITKAQSDRIMQEMLEREYEPPVIKGMPGAKSHEFDCGVSVCWNLGPRSLNWRWAKLFRSGLISESADYLATHYNTAGGRKLRGLVRRRKEEAKLLEYGVYTGVEHGEGVARHKQPKPKKPDPVTKEAQELLTERGFNPGAIDGWMGPKTQAAILAYQKAHPHLVNDGILGPATLAQLRRDADAVKDVFGNVVKKVGPAVTGLGGGGIWADLPGDWIVGAVVLAALCGIGWFVWQKRDVIFRRLNSRKGKVVEV